MLRICSQTYPLISQRPERAPSPVLITLMVMLAIVSGVVPAAFADSDHGGELDRWVPSVALEAGIFGHTGQGSISSTDIVGPRDFTSDSPVSFRVGDIGFSPRDIEFGLKIGEDVSNRIIPRPLSSREEVLAGLVGSTFEIMSPQILDIPTHPRFFMDVNISAALGSEVLLAPDADPSRMTVDPNRLAFAPVGEGSVAGRGSVIRIQPQGPQIHAGLGVAFTFDFGPERIRIKPSVVYTRIRHDLYAVTNRPIRLNDDRGLNADIYDPNDFRLLQFQEDRTEIYHGAGVALEVEYETGNRVGPFDITLYMKGHGTQFFGDLETNLTQSNPDFPGEQVFYKYVQDRWAYRVSTGLRFRFMPRSKQ